MQIADEGQQIELNESNYEVEVGDIVNSMAGLSVASDDSIEKNLLVYPE